LRHISTLFAALVQITLVNFVSLSQLPKPLVLTQTWL